MSETDKESPALELATLEQIADELERRYMAVIVAVHRPDPGTMMCKRGNLCVALGLHTELGWFLKEQYDEDELQEMSEDR